MAYIRRTIVYQGPDKWIKDTLSKSLPDGRNEFASGKAIIIKTDSIQPDSITSLVEFDNTRSYKENFKEIDLTKKED